MNINVNIDLDAIKEKVGTIAQAGVAQTKKMAAITRLKTDNMAQQDALRKAYLALGKACYAAHKAAPDEAMAPLFARVDAALSAIAANNAALEELRAAEEVVIDVGVEEETPAQEEAAAEEPTVDEVMADVQETVSEVTAAPVEETPAEEVPAGEEDGPTDGADGQ